MSGAYPTGMPKVDSENFAETRRWVGEYARSHNLFPQHVFQVRDLSLKIFAQIEPTVSFPPKAALWLECAALLHDIALKDGAQAHHKRARDRIMAMDIPGLNERERAIVACIARYHRRAHPSPQHRVYRDLNARDQGVVQRLSAVLRIADGLDRSHQSTVKNIVLEKEQGGYVLTVYQSPLCAEDVEGALRKSTLFEDVFQKRLRIVAEPISALGSE